MYKDIIGGASLLGIVLALFTYLYNRVGRIEDDVVHCVLCNQRYSELCTRLNKGEERFNELDKKLDNNTILLTRLEVKLDILMRNQSIKFNSSDVG